MAESSELTKLIRKSMGLSESVNRTARSGFSPLPTGTRIVDVNRLPQMDIIHLQDRVDHYQAGIDHLIDRINRIERIKVREFQENDVYEVKKRIERLEQRLALLESNYENRYQFRRLFVDFGWVIPLLLVLLFLLVSIWLS